jgi:hypothetical protein
LTSLSKHRASFAAFSSSDDKISKVETPSFVEDLSRMGFNDARSIYCLSSERASLGSTFKRQSLSFGDESELPVEKIKGTAIAEMTRRTAITFQRFESGLDTVFGGDGVSCRVGSCLSGTLIDLFVAEKTDLLLSPSSSLIFSDLLFNGVCGPSGI